MWVVEDGGAIVAALELIPEKDVLLIENIAVDPAHQGKGLGRTTARLRRGRSPAAGLPRAPPLHQREDDGEHRALHALRLPQDNARNAARVSCRPHAEGIGGTVARIALALHPGYAACAAAPQHFHICFTEPARSAANVTAFSSRELRLQPSGAIYVSFRGHPHSRQRLFLAGVCADGRPLAAGRARRARPRQPGPRRPRARRADRRQPAARRGDRPLDRHGEQQFLRPHRLGRLERRPARGGGGL